MEENDVHAELSSIRQLMERSSKFISLSGLSGVLVGLYALAGARMAIRITTNHVEIGSPPENIPVITQALVVVALIVLILSVATSYWLTVRKARSRQERVWNPVSRRLLLTSAIPFVTGGLVMVILMLTLYNLSTLPLLALTIYYVNHIIHRKSERIQAQLSNLTSIAQE